MSEATAAVLQVAGATGLSVFGPGRRLNSLFAAAAAPADGAVGRRNYSLLPLASAAALKTDQFWEEIRRERRKKKKRK